MSRMNTLSWSGVPKNDPSVLASKEIKPANTGGFKLAPR